jgi:hypothetical protein
MGASRLGAVGLFSLVAFCSGLRAIPPTLPTPAAPMVHSVQAARELAGRIDQFVSASWATRGVMPTARAEDAEFLR